MIGKTFNKICYAILTVSDCNDNTVSYSTAYVMGETIDTRYTLSSGSSNITIRVYESFDEYAKQAQILKSDFNIVETNLLPDFINTLHDIELSTM